MGLLKRHLYLLAAENKEYPIGGDVLTLGQQAVYSTLPEVIKLFRNIRAPLKKLPENFDIKNKIPGWKGTKYGSYTNCQAVLTLLGAEKVWALDVSPYENADLILDLNFPVDKKYYNRFDAILDVGTIEHLFNVPQALENAKLMLKPKGVIIWGAPASNAINHGFYQISPTLFYDYFSVNGFKNFSCFIMQGSLINYEKKAKIYKCKDVAITDNLFLDSKTGVEVMFFAVKSGDTPPKIPIQSKYANWSYWQEKPSLAKENLISSLLFESRRWRPEFIDRIWKKIKTRKMLTYLGKY